MKHDDDPDPARSRGESLRRAVSLAEEAMRMADELGMPVAALHICQGMEILREEAERLSTRPH